MALENRAEAGRLLASRLREYRDQHPLVLAIPRGAVPMGKIVAEMLGGDLDVVLVRKLRAPHNPELAIGSIDETGTVYLDPATRDLWSEPYLHTEKKTQLETLRRRRDEVVCLETPEILYAIGSHFRDFSQVSDDEVVSTLESARRPRVLAGAGASPES